MSYSCNLLLTVYMLVCLIRQIRWTVLLCLFGGGDGEVQLAEAIVMTTVAAVARLKSVNNTVPNKTAFNNIVGHVTRILG